MNRTVPLTPTEAQINSACMSFRHDFGILPKLDREALQRTAKWWFEAWKKEFPSTLEHAAPAAELVVTRKDMTAWRDEWLAAYGPHDETPCVTPFDKYLAAAPKHGGVE